MPPDRLALCGAVLLLSLGACQRDSEPTSPTTAPSLAVSNSTKSFLILGKGNKLPADLASRVSRASGTLTATAGKIGVAVATSASADFKSKASRIPGVEAVALDRMVRWVDPNERVRKANDAARRSRPSGTSIGDDEGFFPLQWALGAIHAPEAWDAGARGTGVRVAVIDGGLNNTHIDLDGNVDVAHSASFVPGFAFNEDSDPDGFSHATFVAGIIAARDNAIGTIGVAPGATIIGVKVLDAGTGTFGQVIQGIVYAATPISQGGAGANIMNVSLGAEFDRQGRDAAHLVNAVSRATTYAYQQGVTVIASAGNSAIDFDHTNNLVSIPAQSPHVIAVAATGPVNFAGGGTNFDRPASYTNFGQSAISFAAPGGDFTLFPVGNWFLDMILSPGSIPENNGYFFAAGTSAAAPYVVGVAALILEKNGGAMHPAQLEAALRRSSDDLGKPGNDDFYGRGFVNALSAVQ
jgi:lantibiotic leader peptide-processing serine protease